MLKRGTTRKRAVRALLVLAGSIGLASASAAENPYRALLDSAYPSAVAPVEVLPTQYRWQGIENLPAGAKLEWDPNSVQWTRIDDRIVLPRARIRIEIPGVDSALISTWERTTPLRKSMTSSWFGEAMVPLVSGAGSKLSVWVRKGRTETEIPLALERVAPNREDSFGIDSSCSPWHVDLRRAGPDSEASSGSAGEAEKSIERSILATVDCDLVRSVSAAGQLASLDLFLFLDGAGDRLKMNGSTVKAEAPSLFRLRLFPQNQPIVLETESGDVIELRYQIPARLNRGFLGVGLGPYDYRFLAPGTDVRTAAGVFTVYGSYELSDTVRFTAFNATAIHRNYFSDTGLYLKSESFKALDRRLSVSVMLGANFVALRYGGRAQKKWGAPQGFEAAYRDFLAPNRSLVLGAFIYPPIDGKSYYNGWLRYGSPALFGELNYLEIRNQIDGASVHVRSLGFSVGFPLARFF